MLVELNAVGQWYKDEPAEAWSFGENILTKEVCEALNGLGMEFEFYASSARINIGSNHCYVPSQYFLYAVKIKPFAILLRRYLDIFEELKSSEQLGALLKKLQLSSSEESEVTKRLDAYSKDNFFSIFNELNARLSAKTIFILNKQKQVTGLRSGDDFYQSILMTILPVPNVSSDILGKIICSLSKSPDVYDILERSYSKAIPYIISSKTGDEILQRLFFVLSIKDNLVAFFDDVSNRTVNYQGIKDLFLLTPTPVAGNQSYFDRPVTYLQDSQKFVHLKKGLLDSAEGLEEVNNFLLDIYKNLEIRKTQLGYIVCDKFISEDRVNGLYPNLGLTHDIVGESTEVDVPRIKCGVNRIYYGAPGTGKSYSINQIAKGHRVYRTVFHPDTQYVDFVGGLKPSMSEDGIEYTFRPGPFTTAYIDALNNPSSQVFLIIEELNRAAAAAVFGELFQLLDRDKNGNSIYSIDISDPDMQQYIDTLAKRDSNGKLKLPSNLSLLASMNSSDQAVMPMDTAFKRRWLFEYLPINYKEATPGLFTINLSGGRVVEIAWKDFAEIINDRLTALEVPEDRLLGHRFLSEQELAGENSALALKGKLLVYLWDDVLRHGKRSQVFTADAESKVMGTFGQLAYEFDAGRPVFSEAIEEKLVDKGQLIPELTLSPQAEDHAD